MTSARSGFGVVVVDDNIFVVGGNDGSGIYMMNIIRSIECGRGI